MDEFQYCPDKKRVVEIDTSTIDSTKTTDLDSRRMGFTVDVLKIPDDILIDPRHQITLHVCPDVNGLLGDENGDSGTITSHFSDATLGTFRTAPSEPINYLIPRSISTPCPPPPPPPTPPTQLAPAPTNNNNSENDATRTPLLAILPSKEDALSSRSEGPSDD